jgi:hypothetical protein
MNLDQFFFNVSIEEKKKMCGYVEVSELQNKIKNINLQERDIISKLQEINQRVLLTTIYRFARMFSFLLWKVIDNLGSYFKEKNNLDNLHIDTIMNIFKTTDNKDILSRDELQRHARFVLQKHGIRPNNTSNVRNDPINKLYTYFLENNSNFIESNKNKFPSILTSLTQPIGNDPVNVWMNYDTRMKYTSPINHTITNNILNSFDAGLCNLEQNIHGLGLGDTTPLNWACGASLFFVNQNSVFYNIAERNNKYIITGPSSTTNMMLDCALLFNIDAKKVLLALVPWMELVKDHSIFEILIAANSYIPDLDYKLIKHGTDTDTGNDILELKAIENLYNKVFPQGSSGGSKIEKKKSNKKIKNKQTGGMDYYQKYNVIYNDKGTVYYPQCNKEEAKNSIGCLIADAWTPEINIPEIDIKKLSHIIKLSQERGINISSEYYLNTQEDKREYTNKEPNKEPNKESSSLQIPFASNAAAQTKSSLQKPVLSNELKVQKLPEEPAAAQTKLSPQKPFLSNGLNAQRLTEASAAAPAAGGRKKQKTKAKKPKN